MYEKHIIIRLENLLYSQPSYQVIYQSRLDTERTTLSIYTIKLTLILQCDLKIIRGHLLSRGTHYIKFKPETNTKPRAGIGTAKTWHRHRIDTVSVWVLFEMLKFRESKTLTRKPCVDLEKFYFTNFML